MVKGGVGDLVMVEKTPRKLKFEIDKLKVLKKHFKITLYLQQLWFGRSLVGLQTRVELVRLWSHCQTQEALLQKQKDSW